MPIKVTCQCGKSFAAKDELAGKAVKCPNCQQPLRIPGAPAASSPRAPAAPQPGLAQPLPSAAPRQPATSASAFGPPPGAGGGVHSLFDEVGLKQAPTGAIMCPGCAQPLPPNAVICIKCGYNTKLGRRMETVRMGAEGSGPGGHDATTADLMNKAAISIEEDKEEERKKTREGAPWWVYLIGLVFSIGFIIMMMLLPRQVALMTGGVVMYGLAFIVNTYAWVRVLIIAFTESVGHGIGCLICGLYFLIYCWMRWDQCGGYFLMMVATNVVSNLVMWAIQAGAGMGGEEEARVPPPPPPPPAAIARADFVWPHPALLKSQPV
jgi:hypothetical protein